MLLMMSSDQQWIALCKANLLLVTSLVADKLI